MAIKCICAYMSQPTTKICTFTLYGLNLFFLYADVPLEPKPVKMAVLREARP